MKGTKGEVKVGGEGQVGTRGKGGWAWATWKWLSQVPSGLSARPARNIHSKQITNEHGRVINASKTNSCSD